MKKNALQIVTALALFASVSWAKEGEGSGAGVPHPGDSPHSPHGTEVAEGFWGGEHIRLNLGAASGALDYDCAHGTLDESLRLDADGAFDVKGSHVIDHGGPIKPGEIENRHPARYLGHFDAVSGEIVLIVILTDTRQHVGTYRLKLGATANVTKCL